MQIKDLKKNKVPTFISVVNQKGGVGKTTTVLNLATTVAASGKKVLILDLDAQGNASTGLGILSDERKLSTYDFLMSNENINNTIKNTSIENLYIIPASQDLSSIDMDLAEMKKRATRLKNIFKKNNITEINFDYIFMDCPPALNMLTVNSLALANFIIIPLQTEFFALEGLSQLMITIKQIRKTLNQELKILGILLTMYDRRNNLSLQIEEDVRSTLNDLVFNTVIPRNIKLSEAPSFSMPGVIYDQRCLGSIAYQKLTAEFFIREKKYFLKGEI